MTPTPTKLTPRKAALLEPFLADVAAEFTGYELQQLVDLASGTVYPMLAELEDAGVLLMREEQVQGRRGPRTRYHYRLNQDVLGQLRIARAELHERQQLARQTGRRLPGLPGIGIDRGIGGTARS